MDWNAFLPKLLSESPWMALVIGSMWWVANNIVKPLVSSHQGFLQEVTTTLEEKTDLHRRNSDALDLLAQSSNTLAETSKTQAELLRELKEQSLDRRTNRTKGG